MPTRSRSTRLPARRGGVQTWAWIGLSLALGCSTSEPGAARSGGHAAGSPVVAGDAAREPSDPKVGYDVRRLRPSEGKSLSEQFEALRAQAVAEGKVAAVLFTANWCESCRGLFVELGSFHPASSIGHVRILELLEEDWNEVQRLNEYNHLRARWSRDVMTYPFLVVLDDAGQRRDEMRSAVDRFEEAGLKLELSTWFVTLRPDGGLVSNGG